MTYPTKLALPMSASVKSLHNDISYCFCDTAADITYSTDPTVPTDPTDPTHLTDPTDPTDPIAFTDPSY
jgi:hypothetical protein